MESVGVKSLIAGGDAMSSAEGTLGLGRTVKMDEREGAAESFDGV